MKMSGVLLAIIIGLVGQVHGQSTTQGKYTYIESDAVYWKPFNKPSSALDQQVHYVHVQ